MQQFTTEHWTGTRMTLRRVEYEVLDARAAESKEPKWHLCVGTPNCLTVMLLPRFVLLSVALHKSAWFLRNAGFFRSLR